MPTTKKELRKTPSLEIKPEFFHKPQVEGEVEKLNKNLVEETKPIQPKAADKKAPASAMAEIKKL